MKRTGITKKIQAALMLLACPFAAFASQDGGEDYHPLNSVEDETNLYSQSFVVLSAMRKDCRCPMRI